jgi:arsenical pump membrane protein
VLPISNPANLVVFQQGMPALGRWLLAFGAPSVVSIVTTFAILRFVFRGELRGSVDQMVAPVTLSSSGRLVLYGLGFVVAVLLAVSALHAKLGLPTCLAAMAISATVSLRVKSNPLPLLRHISWSTLGLVAGLFVLVDAAESQGALKFTQAALRFTQHLPAGIGAAFIGLVVGVTNNLVNNLPVGLLAGATLQAAHVHGLLTHAVLIGVDLGPNLSVTGSLATILWLIALRKEDVEVSFWQFLKIGLVAMPVALLAAIGTSILMHAHPA